MKEFERDGKNGEKTSLVIKRYPPSPDRCVAIFGSAHRYQRERIKFFFAIFKTGRRVVIMGMRKINIISVSALKFN